MVIAISGIPYFTSSTLFVPIAIILFLTFLVRGKQFDKEFILFILLLTIVTVLQTYIFNFFSFQSTVGVYLRVIIGYLIVKILKENFIPYYINILYYLSIIGTIIYLSIVTFPSLESLYKLTLVPILSIFNFAGTRQETIIFYNLQHLESLRNSGPFWEPGAFAGYLMIAIIFIYFHNIKNRKRKLIILVFALITTFSTTAFFALSIFLYFYYYNTIKNIIIKLTVASIIIYSSYYAFFNIDFLGQKIEHQFNMIRNAKVYGKDSNTQRFFNILRDIEDFKGHELIGRGSNPLTRYSFKHKEQIRTVGITDILVRMGLLLFLFIFYFLYKSICSIVKNSDKKGKGLYCVGIILTILTILMSEVYFNFPLYWSLIFIFLIYKRKRKKNDLYSNTCIQ
jgi:hypothetical protein